MFEDNVQANLSSHCFGNFSSIYVGFLLVDLNYSAFSIFQLSNNNEDAPSPMIRCSFYFFSACSVKPFLYLLESLFPGQTSPVQGLISDPGFLCKSKIISLKNNQMMETPQK